MDFTESMLGMPSPPWVAPLDPSGFIVKCVRGEKARSAGVPSRSGLGRKYVGFGSFSTRSAYPPCRSDHWSPTLSTMS